MIKLGIMGLNEGNGHPYSFAAIFNGYDEKALGICPFPVIRDYLQRYHKNRVFIENARVTHIWTQEREISEKIARVSRIPNIADNPLDFIGEVDGVILARDDPWNHWRMAKPFLERKIPIYIDKLLAHNVEDLNKFIDACGDNFPIMAGSSSRYTRNIEKAKREIDIEGIKTIHGVSKCTWLRYASHLLDGIFYLFGTEVKSVQNIGKKGFDVVRLEYKNGLNVLLQVIEDISLPIEFTCYANNRIGHYTVVFSDRDFSSYFYGFCQMLKKFVDMVKTGKQPIPFDEMVKISRIIIAGEVSREEGNRVVYPDELK